MFGLPAPHLVPEQSTPDPEFPTVPFPNPEEGKGVWNLSFAAADRVGARLCIANDPDADRLAAAERLASGSAAGPSAGEKPANAGWRTFSGNEIGILLAHWVWVNTVAKTPVAPGPVRFACLFAPFSPPVSLRLLTS